MTAANPDDAAPPARADFDDPVFDDLTLSLVEERLDVARRRVPNGFVRVSTATEVVEEIAEVELDRYSVEVTRVPMGRVVDTRPLARAEGDTTIVSVVEERLVLVKQLVLVEELHIRHVIEREMAREVVTLRRQRATVERRDGEKADRASEPDSAHPLNRPAAVGSPQATKAPFR